jgi:hypothetical protein
MASRNAKRGYLKQGYVYEKQRDREFGDVIGMEKSLCMLEKLNICTTTSEVEIVFVWSIQSYKSERSSILRTFVYFPLLNRILLHTFPIIRATVNVR